MRIPTLVTAVLVALCSTPPAVAAGENPPGVPQPPPGEGWTREEARKEERVPTLTVIAATVVQLSVRSNGRFIVTLDNGTVWSQSQNKSDVRVSVGDNITLKKASLGSYLLVTRDGVSTRVKRDR
jgi:photosystem II stability/assembly factor-like uncharacterized protein